MNEQQKARIVELAMAQEVRMAWAYGVTDAWRAAQIGARMERASAEAFRIAQEAAR